MPDCQSDCGAGPTCTGALADSCCDAGYVCDYVSSGCVSSAGGGPTTSTTMTTTSMSTTTSTTSTTSSKSTTTKATPTKVLPAPHRCNPAGAQPTFHLVLKGTSLSYFSLAPAPNSQGGPASSVLHFSTTLTGSPSLFTFNNQCNLVVASWPHSGWIADVRTTRAWGPNDFAVMFFDSQSAVTSNTWQPLECTFSTTAALECKLPGLEYGKWYGCEFPSTLSIGSRTVACEGVLKPVGVFI